MVSTTLHDIVLAAVQLIIHNIIIIHIHILLSVACPGYASSLTLSSCIGQLFIAASHTLVQANQPTESLTTEQEQQQQLKHSLSELFMSDKIFPKVCCVATHKHILALKYLLLRQLLILEGRERMNDMNPASGGWACTTHPIPVCMADEVSSLSLGRVIVLRYHPLLQLLPGEAAIFVQVPVLSEVLSLCWNPLWLLATGPLSGGPNLLCRVTGKMIHTRTCTCTHTHARMHTHMHAHTHIHTDTHRHTHTHRPKYSSKEM